MVIRVSARDSAAEIRAALVAMKQLDTATKKQMNKSIRDVFNPLWQTTVRQGAATRTDTLIAAKGLRIKTGNPPSLYAAGSKRPISRRGGGLIPARHWPGIEYGSGPIRATYETTSRAGRRYTLTRNVTAGYPRRRREGRLFGPAAAEILPRLAAHWSQSVLRMFFDALEEGR